MGVCCVICVSSGVLVLKKNNHCCCKFGVLGFPGISNCWSLKSVSASFFAQQHKLFDNYLPFGAVDRAAFSCNAHPVNLYKCTKRFTEYVLNQERQGCSKAVASSPYCTSFLYLQYWADSASCLLILSWIHLFYTYSAFLRLLWTCSSVSHWRHLMYVLYTLKNTSFLNCLSLPWRQQWRRTDLSFLWILSEFHCRPN